jgi:hypothetical protein
MSLDTLFLPAYPPLGFLRRYVRGAYLAAILILRVSSTWRGHRKPELPFSPETIVWIGLRVFGLQEMNQIFRNGRGQREDRPWWSSMPSLIDGPDNALKGQLSPQCRACRISNEGYKTMQAWVLFQIRIGRSTRLTAIRCVMGFSIYFLAIGHESFD